MTTRRGFLQSVGAALGSTILPSGAIASIATAAPVAEVAAGVMAVAAVAAVARQFKSSGVVIDTATFEPISQVVIFNGDESVIKENVKYSEIFDDPERLAEIEELDKLYPNSNVHSKWTLAATRLVLEKKGMPPLTHEETSIIMARKVETV
jgi:uncharacterized protein (DUF362 family)